MYAAEIGERAGIGDRELQRGLSLFLQELVIPQAAERPNGNIEVPAVSCEIPRPVSIISMLSRSRGYAPLPAPRLSSNNGLVSYVNSEVDMRRSSSCMLANCSSIIFLPLAGMRLYTVMDTIVA